MATKVLTLRLEDDAWREVLAFQHRHHMESPGRAIQAMIEIATRDMVQLEEAFRRAAWKTGIREASKKLREKIDAAVADSLKVTDRGA